MTEAPAIDRLAVIGIGLIGSSIARAARTSGAAREIVAADQDPGARETAMRLGVVDAIHADPADAVRGADMVVLATPVRAAGAVMAAAAPALADGAVLTDVGSVKQAVIDAVRPHLPTDGRRVAFVPAHPIAGTEQSGPEAGFATLFERRWCLITPLADADPAAVEAVRRFWERLGSRVETMSPERHDRVLAVTSHLPHLIAYTIVGTASDLESVDEEEVMKYSAAGFRDFTRIAASDPVMWRDVFMTNREAVLELLGRFTEDLFALQRAIRWGDAETLQEHFTRTRTIRRGILALGQDVDAPDFGRRVASVADGDAGREADAADMSKAARTD